MDFRTASIAGAIALTFSTSSFALDLQPYTTKGAPIGKTIFSLGRVSADASSANENSTSVRLTHYFDLAGRRAVVDAKQFYRGIEPKGATKTLSGQTEEKGISALAFGGGVYLIDDKAAGDYLLAGMFIVTPTGEYSSTKTVNAGENRYTFIPKVAYHTSLTEKIDMAVSADLAFYTKNDKVYLNAYSTSVSQEKDAQFNSQASFMYAVDPSLNLNTSIFYHEGGKTKHSGGYSALDKKTQNTQASVGFRKITDVGAFSVSYKKDINHVSGAELNSQWDLKWKIAW